MSRFARRFVVSCGAAWPWLLVFAVGAALVLARAAYPQVVTFPDGWLLPLEGPINVAMDWIVENLRGVTRAISGGLGWAFWLAQEMLVHTPWLVTLAAISLISWQGGGLRLTLLIGAILLYILVSGYWTEAMNTLALVLVALPLSVLLGFAAGYLGYRSETARGIIMPTLDLMQTVPAFAYLIPILLLFGFGPVVGLIASVVFAVPPMVRNTILGFQRIPPAIIESACMSGCSRRQQFLWAELPTALPQMLIGVNQTTMAALSMVIIAAIIGGFEDIGWEVLSAMRKAQFGQGLLSGIVIVVLAVMLDRLTGAYAARQLPTTSHAGWPWRRFAVILVAAICGAWLLAWLVPFFADWPEPLVFFAANAINAATTDFVMAFGEVMSRIKNAILYFVLLPVKLGFERAVVPFTWGVTFTPLAKTIYWLLAAVACAVAFGLGRWRAGVAAVIVAGFLFLGATGLPWALVVLAVGLLAWQVGGGRLLALAVFSLGFLLLNGIWPPAMLSIYLCFVAVVICILLGGVIGIWAASSDVVSQVIRPINDMLQTLPQFVFLIPALMLFQVGDFTALLAVVAYAIVPMIRYTEHGLRSVPRPLIEAGVSSGCSPWQMFWQIRLPLAQAQILIGINQTILYALGMLVIAALVGTTDLGQAIYIALGKANAGAGLVAGLGMALIAMTADRILQAVIRSGR